jgi:flap endonuclease-1
MGIKGLAAFLRKKCPLAFVPTDLSNYRGLRVAVDVPIYAYKFAFYKTAVSDTETVVQGFLKHHRTWTQRYGMHVVYVFDGPCAAAKNFEHERRDKAKESLKRKQTSDLQELKEEAADYLQDGNFLKLMNTQLQIEKVSRRVTVVTKTDYECLQNVFTEKEIPFCFAEADAEKKCASLCLSGQADIVATEDYDVLVCGAPRVLRNVSKSPEEIHLQTVLESLQFTMNQFVQFCVLCGSDFSIHLPNIGPAAAYKAIAAYGTIENYFEKDERGKKVALAHSDFNFEAALAQFRHE